MKTLIIILSFVLFASFPTSAENIENSNSSTSKTSTNFKSDNLFTLKGKVVDFNTNEALTGVLVEYDGSKFYTDFDGCFEIKNICKDKCELSLNMISYTNKTVVIDAIKNIDMIKIEMKR